MRGLRGGLRSGLRGSLRGFGAGGGSPHMSARQIAQELVSPTKLWHLTVLGDSRHSAKQLYWLTDCAEVAWGGRDNTLSFGFDRPDAGGAIQNYESTAMSGVGPYLSPLIAPAAATPWWPVVSHECKFGGTNTLNSNALAARIWGGGIALATDAPLLLARLQALGPTTAVRARMLLYRHTGAVSAVPGVRLNFNPGTTQFGAPGADAGPMIYDCTGSGYLDCYAEHPAGYDWAAYPTQAIELCTAVNAATVAGETVSFTHPWIEMQGPGIVLMSCAISGSSIKRYVEEATFPESLWTGYFPAVGANRMLWIDLGTNNPELYTQAQHEAFLELLIARHRLVDPYAPVVISTAFPNSTDGATTYYRDGAIAVAARVPGVLLIDTFATLTYAQAVAAGYMGGTIHRSDAGNHALFADIGDRIAAAA